MMPHIACYAKMALLLICLSALSACDDPLPPPGRPAPLTQDITLRGGVDGERKVDGADLKPGDCAALMAYVNARDGDRYKTYRRLEILGEMQDRGICVPHDPARAFVAFEEASTFRGRDWHPVTAWKLWHGDGVTRDREEAKRQFRNLVATTAIYREHEYRDRSIQRVMRERSLPQFAAEGLEWMENLKRDDGEFAEWLGELYVGEARYLDGTELPKRPQLAKLSQIRIHTPETTFRFGKVLFDRGRDREVRGFGKSYLTVSAYGGHIPAALELIDIYGDPNELEFYLQSSAYKWALIAKALGGDVDEILQDHQDRFEKDALEFGRSRALSLLKDMGIDG